MHQSLIPLNGWTGVFIQILDIWLDGCRTVGKYYMYKDYKSLKVNPALDPVNLLLEKEYFSSAGPATVFAGAASAAAAVSLHFPPNLLRGNNERRHFPQEQIRRTLPTSWAGSAPSPCHERPPRPSKTSCLLWPKRRGLSLIPTSATNKKIFLSNGSVLGFVMRCELLSRITAWVPGGIGLKLRRRRINKYFINS